MSRSHEDYIVGWVCPLEVEQTAALEMLDESHERLPQPRTDHNVYTLGSISGHNVVIAGLYEPGNNPAAMVVAQMRMTFPNLRFGLLVGIGGGDPVKTDNGMIRLGDVVVSKPTGGHSGVVQYDHGNARAGELQRTGALDSPPAVLLSASQDLAAKLARSRRDPIQENIARIDTSIRGLQRYRHPGAGQDHLYNAHYIHPRPGFSCDECDPSQRIERPSDDDDDESSVVIHRGTIASGELEVKDALLRDRLAQTLGLLCFEMEAAGALSDFPCLVIRGISDYCDSHKNDRWHGYAAAAAAAYARQLFVHIPVDLRKRYISVAADKDIHRLRHWQDDRESRDVLDWLTKIDYGPQQSDYLGRRQEGTGQWLLDSAEFTTWAEAKKKTLFCPGIPGAGKTILTSIVVDELTARFGDDKAVGVAYTYCNYRRKHEQKTQDLLSSLLKQLAENATALPEEVRALHAKHKMNRTRPSLAELSTTLQSVAALYSRVLIIVDALDECQASDGCRERFLEEIFVLQTRCGANIFATSRFLPEITEAFADSITLEIRSSPEDVRRYVDSQISRLPHFVREDPDLEEEVKANIVKAVDGMCEMPPKLYKKYAKLSRFLLAHLHLGSLEGKTTRKKLQRAINGLATGPKAYDQAYEDAMKRIYGQAVDQKELSEQVLAWITCAERPLRAIELQHALAVELGEQELDEDNLPGIDDMLSVCAGLVTVDEESDVIRLVHFTTHEYFRRTQGYWFGDAETDIVKICATYLSFRVFESGGCPTGYQFGERLRSNPLYDYVACNWGHHARKASTLCEEVKVFLGRESAREAASQALNTARSPLEPINMHFFPRRVGALHLAAYFGIDDAVRLLIGSHDPEVRDSYGQTPLYWAAANGQDVVVKLLLENKGDVSSTDMLGRTPLRRAAESGHLPVIQVLLQEGDADANCRDFSGQTPLMAAARRGHDAVVKVLLDTGKVHADSRDEDRLTALSHAAKNGRGAVVRLLLDAAQVDVDVIDKFHRTPLSYAVLDEHKEVVKLLLDTAEVNVDFKDDRKFSPLWMAAWLGSGAVVKLLLDNKANIESGDRWNDTPLSKAAQSGHTAVVKQLLDNGANIESKDIQGKTPLSQAAQYGNKAIVKQLLERGAAIESMNNDGQTPLTVAAGYGSTAIVTLLLESGAVIDSRDDRGQTPFSLAAEPAHDAIAALTLEHMTRRGSRDSLTVETGD